MFHVTYEDKNISFSFKHTRGVKFEIKPNKVISDVTECDFLVNGQVYSGLAACSALDKFEKETGRKVALKRAMEEAKLSRDARTYIWSKYFTRMVR